MRIDKVFTQGNEVYLVSENKVFRVRNNYKPGKSEGLKEMKDFVIEH